MEGLTVSPDFLFGIGLLGLLPFIAVSVTSFVKIAVVFSLVRNALGIQQIPPNMVIYGLAMTMSAYIMLPVGLDVAQRAEDVLQQHGALLPHLGFVAEPVGAFLERHADPDHITFFEETVEKLWAGQVPIDAKRVRILVLLPAFTVTELSEAFKIGFLIYLPFIALDMVVANILLALGMMMLSPVTISLPFKLFLFVAVDGWTRLVHGLVLSYQIAP